MYLKASGLKLTNVQEITSANWDDLVVYRDMVVMY